MDLLELRTTAGSQNSLPECFDSAQNAAENQTRLRTSKSLGDLRSSSIGRDEPSGSSREASQSGGMVPEQMEMTESSTSKVTDWLSHLNTT
ncbi:hypothetical protein WR25_07752 isoform B [Diploscapter pachys]|nr:hypothetical protein WR25_07752 isoform B [Diploscapter pachys]